MSKSYATQKQLDYILVLHNKLNGTNHGYLSQTGIWSHMTIQRGISKAAASAKIDELLEELRNK